MTQTQLFAHVRKLGLSIRRTGFGPEIRISPKPQACPDGTKREALAYYTDDRDDALATARFMAARLPIAVRPH